MDREAQEVARRLIEEHGIDLAYREAMTRGMEAQRDGDFLSLSVWREVKRFITERARNPREISDLEPPPFTG